MVDLKDKLYAEFGGAAMCTMELCEHGIEGPAIRGHDPCEYFYADGVLCLYGFDLEETTIDLVLYSPTDEMYFGRVDPENPGYCGACDCVYIWLPVGVPTGEWRVRAVTNDHQIYEDSFVVDPKDVYEYYGGPKEAGPATSIVPHTPINPFESHFCPFYLPGDPMIVNGTNFEPGERFPLGIYYNHGEASEEECSEENCSSLALRGSQMVEADSNGDFTTVIPALSTPGMYYVVAITDPPGGNIGPQEATVVDCYWTEGRLVRHLVTYVDGELGPDLVFAWVGPDDRTLNFHIRGDYSLGKGSYLMLEDGRWFNAYIVQEILEENRDRLPGYERSEVDGGYITVTLTSSDVSRQFFESLSAIEVVTYISEVSY